MSQCRGARLTMATVSRRYGEVRAVQEISLDVQPGEFLTLLGPSGSGKTSLLRMIAGFVAPSAGDILLDAQSVLLKPPYDRNIGVVFQNYALFPHMTVAENIAFPLRVRRLAAAEVARRVAAALELVKLPGYEHRLPRQLSGGQQQRIALARAVVFDPPLLLMDEPLGALDKKLRVHMQLELKQIQARLGVTVVYVTHDQEEALTMSDRIAVMNHGRVEQLGSARDLYERPANRFVADFLGESNLLACQILNAGEDRWVVETESSLKVVVCPHPSLRVGDRAILVLRPERVRLVNGRSGLANVFDGVVEEAVYLGEAVRYLVRLGSRDQIVAKIGGSTPPPVGGSPVTVGWDVSEAVLIPPDSV